MSEITARQVTAAFRATITPAPVRIRTVYCGVNAFDVTIPRTNAQRARLLPAAWRSDADRRESLKWASGELTRHLGVPGMQIRVVTATSLRGGESVSLVLSASVAG